MSEQELQHKIDSFLNRRFKEVFYKDVSASSALSFKKFNQIKF